MPVDPLVLARRVVAHPQWRWERGLLAAGDGWYAPARICEIDDATGEPNLWEYRGYLRGPMGQNAEPRWSEYDPAPLPILTDPVTLAWVCGPWLEGLVESKLYPSRLEALADALGAP